MSVRNYYRWSLLLPVLVPVLAIPAFALGVDLLAGVALWLWWSLIFGGVPYLFFALGFLLWTRSRTDTQIRVGVLLSPLAFVAVLVPCFALFLAVDASLSSSMDFLGMLAGFSVAFGYGYVALAELGRLLLRPSRAPAEPLVAV